MTKTGKKIILFGDKRNDMTSLIYSPEEFPEDTATQNIETTQNGSKLQSKMRVLNGGEVPEQLMIWLKDLGDKILKNTILTEPRKLDFL